MPDSEGGGLQAAASNRSWWNEVTPAHVASDFYDTPGFVAGRQTIPQFVRDEVGDVAGRNLLHLQCHFGQDTLSWVRLGAIATGLDFSVVAIAEARRLARATGLSAEFVVGDVLEPGTRFDGRFDIVFTSFGVLVWLHDLTAWARTVARALKPGGMFYISDFHPLMDALDDSRVIETTSDLVLRYPYFNDGRPQVRSDEAGYGDYADPTVPTTSPTYEYAHSLGEICEAVTSAGLVIQMFREHPFCMYPARPGMVRGDDGMYRLPDGVLPIPLMFSIRAQKSGQTMGPTQRTGS